MMETGENDLRSRCPEEREGVRSVRVPNRKESRKGVVSRNVNGPYE